MMKHPVDLSIFRQRPTPRLIIGLVVIGVSYIIGWPAVAALAFLAVWFKEPLIAVIGCPTIYVLSHVVFIIGAWIMHAPQHMGILTKYVIQSFIKKYSSNNFYQKS